jgi:nitrogen fixation-related uncharacterized protein
VFFWAVKSNQFEDLERQGSSILYDDDVTKKPNSNQSVNSKHQKHTSQKNKND